MSATGAGVTSAGDAVTGIERVTDRIVTRGVLLDVGRAIGGGELADGFAVIEEHLEATIAAQGSTAAVVPGDVVLMRTGQLGRCRRDGWGSAQVGASVSASSAPGATVRIVVRNLARSWAGSSPAKINAAVCA